MHNEFFTHAHFKQNGININHMKFPLDYTHGRNGLSRFNKDFILESDKTGTRQILFNLDNPKKWSLF